MIKFHPALNLFSKLLITLFFALVLSFFHDEPNQYFMTPVTTLRTRKQKGGLQCRGSHVSQMSNVVLMQTRWMYFERAGDHCSAAFLFWMAGLPSVPPNESTPPRWDNILLRVKLLLFLCSQTHSA